MSNPNLVPGRLIAKPFLEALGLSTQSVRRVTFDLSVDDGAKLTIERFIGKAAMDDIIEQLPTLIERYQLVRCDEP